MSKSSMALSLLDDKDGEVTTVAPGECNKYKYDGRLCAKGKKISKVIHFFFTFKELGI